MCSSASTLAVPPGSPSALHSSGFSDGCGRCRLVRAPVRPVRRQLPLCADRPHTPDKPGPDAQKLIAEVSRIMSISVPQTRAKLFANFGKAQFPPV
jgi:hypothetical protein